MRLPGPLVKPEWLEKNSAHPKLVVLDATMIVTANKQSAQDPGLEMQIPGTRTFDLEKVRDHATALPHMMPSPEDFTAAVQALGVDHDSLVVVYDRKGVYSSPRVRWMFKAMGHEEVSVLDGGFPDWLAKGCPCESRSVRTGAAGDFVARPHGGLFCDARTVERVMDDPGCVIIDARPEGRFLGQEPEPRPGLRCGHIPGSKNVPFDRVLDGPRLRGVEEIVSVLRARSITLEKRLIFSCGSGVTACIVALAAEAAGCQSVSVYDGSWSEWGLPSSRPNRRITSL